MTQFSTCQIIIKAATGLLPDRAYYTCGLQGRYEAKLIGVAFSDTTVSTEHRVITVQSDSFRLIYGNTQQSLMFPNHAERNHGNPQGEFPVIIDANSSIDLTLTASTAYDNGANNAFQFCILTFAVKKIEA
jgi:hypothetical protein